MGIMLFLVPALVIYLVFQIIPIIGSIYFSLVDWNGIAGSAAEICRTEKLYRWHFTMQILFFL